MKIMSFNVCSLRTWGCLGSEEWFCWKGRFKSIVESNGADVVLLQEVYKSRCAFVQEICVLLGDDWNFFSTEEIACCRDNLHNAVLYNKRILRNPVDLTCNFREERRCWDKTQVVKFCIEGGEFIVANAHLVSDGNSKIVVDSDHGKDLRSLCDLLENLEVGFPNAFILSAGDFNYSYDLLSEYLDKNNRLSLWLLDDEKTASVCAKGIQTTLTKSGCMGNAMDHFLYGNKLKERVKKLDFNTNASDKWNFALGVLHLTRGNKTLIQIGDREQMSFPDYYLAASDHFPIVTEIDI